MSDSFLPASTSSNNLPRGLVSKSGLPLNPNQRLPSLRSSLSKPSLLFQSSASFNQNLLTLNKSPVKRAYEPNMPDCRKSNESKPFQNCVKQGKNDWKGSPLKAKRQTTKKPKKLIQLESPVFTGDSRTTRKTPSETTKSEKKSKGKKAPNSSLSSTFQEQTEDSIEPAFIEGKLYQDDFIDRSNDKESGNIEHLPQGWESLSLPTPKSSSNSINEDWLSSSKGDKFFLFQLPKMFENNANMKLGKLRVYESGKVELVDNPSDLTFEIAKVGHPEVNILNNTTVSLDNASINKTEENVDVKQITQDFVAPVINREVVMYSGRNLVCLGKLEAGAAIVIPKILNNG